MRTNDKVCTYTSYKKYYKSCGYLLRTFMYVREVLFNTLFEHISYTIH